MNDDFMQRLSRRLSEDLGLLARLHDREPDLELAEGLRTMAFPGCLTLPLDDSDGQRATRLMALALETLPLQPDAELLDELAADYTNIYLTHAIGASPQESVWLDEDGLICQDAMFQVRQWYGAWGLKVPDWRTRPDDHLVHQLQFIAHLLEQGALEEAARFMDEHLLRWLGLFAGRVMARCDTPWFAATAALTAAYCEALRDLLAELTGHPRPTAEEIEARMAPRRKAEGVPVAFMPGMGPVV